MDVLGTTRWEDLGLKGGGASVLKENIGQLKCVLGSRKLEWRL